MLLLVTQSENWDNGDLKEWIQLTDKSQICRGMTVVGNQAFEFLSAKECENSLTVWAT